ncbi:MAG: hypothetical protein AAFY73_00115 [Pseudomonadota bacterium]
MTKRTSHGLNALLPHICAACAGLLAWTATAQAQQVDPDIFSNRQAFIGAPHFFREAAIQSSDVPGVWPFKLDSGNVICLRMDGVDFAMFEAPDDQRGPGDEPFMLHDNIFMLMIGKAITQSDHLKSGLDPATIGAVLANVYQVALRKCGSPYFQ